MKDWSSSYTSYDIGGHVVSSEPIRTKWNRFMFWAFDKPIPTRTMIYVCVDKSVDGSLDMEKLEGNPYDIRKN